MEGKNMSRMLELVRKNTLRFVRDPITLLFLIIIPVIYYGLLGFIFGSIDLQGLTNAAPGYLLYGPLMVLSFALVVLTGEKKVGIYRRLASTEVKNYEVVLSSIISNIALVFMQFGIGAAILVCFGWIPTVASFLDGFLGIAITMFLFAFFLLALAFAFAPVFKKPETAGGGVWMLIAPLAILSGVYVPMSVLGETIRNIAAWLPTRFAIVALENILVNGQSIFYPETLVNLGLLALYSTLIFVIGIKAFKKFMN
jgi:ABC-2 type transport system permease protein